MALTGSALTPIMMGQFASKGILGTHMSGFCKALSEGLVVGFLAQNKVITTDVGFLPSGSPGTGIGKMSGLVAAPMTGLAISLLASEVIIGSKSPSLAEAVVNAIVLYFNAANITITSHPTVAIGSGIGKVTGLSASLLTNIVAAQMLANGITGAKMINVVKPICTAFATSVMATAIVTCTISGSPLLINGSPVPGGGGGMGTVT